MRRFLRLTLIGLLSVLFVTACRETTAPVSAGQYVLRSIDGQSLPAQYAENLEFPNRMFADTLVLGEDGRGEWRMVVEESVGGPKNRYVDEFTYTGTSHI